MIKLLRYTYCIELLTAACISAIFETGMLAEGDLATNEVLNYWLSLIGVAMILVLLPLALRLMKFAAVKKSVAQSEANYLRWSMIRIYVLGIPLLYNLVCYYLTGCETTFVYMALMTAVCFLFIWPSRDRMADERELQYSQEEQ